MVQLLIDNHCLPSVLPKFWNNFSSISQAAVGRLCHSSRCSWFKSIPGSPVTGEKFFHSFQSRLKGEINTSIASLVSFGGENNKEATEKTQQSK